MCKEGAGSVSILRDIELFFNLEPLWVHVDDQKEGSLLTGERCLLTLPEGRHRIWVQWEDHILGVFRSNHLIIEVLPDSFISLECGSHYQGLRLLFSSLYLLNHDGCFYLRRTEA